jgi:hypothetical protein
VKAGVNPGTVHKARTFLSSVLRHAAESEVIPGNPVSLVRPPKASHRDAVQPLAPAIVEAIRSRLLDPALTVLLSTYAHLIDEYAESERIDAEAEITKARAHACVL